MDMWLYAWSAFNSVCALATVVLLWLLIKQAKHQTTLARREELRALARREARYGLPEPKPAMKDEDKEQIKAAIRDEQDMYSESTRPTKRKGK
jgi:hypothetical protein